MELVIIKDGKPQPNPDLRALPVFRKLFSDTRKRVVHYDKSHEELIDIFLYIYYMCDYRSWALEKFPKDDIIDYTQRKELVLRTLKLEKVKEDEVLLEAMEAYKELVDNIHLRALRAARVAMNATIDFLEGVDYDKRTKSGGLLYTPKMVLESLNNLEVARSNFEKIEQRIRHSIKETGKIRGGGGQNIGIFEDPTEEVKSFYGHKDD